MQQTFSKNLILYIRLINQIYNIGINFFSNKILNSFEILKYNISLLILYCLGHYKHVSTISLAISLYILFQILQFKKKLNFII